MRGTMRDWIVVTSALLAVSSLLLGERASAWSSVEDALADRSSRLILDIDGRAHEVEIVGNLPARSTPKGRVARVEMKWRGRPGEISWRGAGGRPKHGIRFEIRSTGRATDNAPTRCEGIVSLRSRMMAGTCKGPSLSGPWVARPRSQESKSAKADAMDSAAKDVRTQPLRRARINELGMARDPRIAGATKAGDCAPLPISEVSRKTSGMSRRGGGDEKADQVRPLTLEEHGGIDRWLSRNSASLRRSIELVYSGSDRGEWDRKEGECRNDAYCLLDLRRQAVGVLVQAAYGR